MADTTPKPAPSSVTVTTTARLHFGFIDPSGRSPHPFGSIGLSLDQPATRLTLSHADSSDASGPDSNRAEHYLKTIAESFGLDRDYRLELTEAIPSHAGLGSGTQLALAAGSAFACLEGLALSPLDIAERLGRGARSGIGIATFESGGAVLDSGPRNGQLPSLVARVPFPEQWRVLLIFDPGTKGLDGASESAAFDALPNFPEVEREELSERIAAMAMPALQFGDFSVFSEEVSFLQQRMGTYFGPVQGGHYTSLRVGAVLDWLRTEGIVGLGQSSWGPTGFAFAPTESAGRALLAAVRGRPDSSALRFVLARGRNDGAEIEPFSAAP